MVFSGKGKNPTVLNTAEEVIAFVSRTPGSLGYVSGGAVTDNVKTLSVQ